MPKMANLKWQRIVSRMRRQKSVQLEEEERNSITGTFVFLLKEKNRSVLRNLSIVTRQLASKVTDRTERNRMIEESIQYAKQAVELDVKDGASWCKTTSLLFH